MFVLQPKLENDRSKEWKCFSCLHVRTGTILLGSWHLILHLIALGFQAAIVRNPHLADALDHDEMGPALPTPLSNTQPSAYPQVVRQQRDHMLIYNDVDTGALVTVCTLAITLTLIYGAARGKPAHLLPFFCLQIFDFGVTVLTATGYLCYMRSIHRLVVDSQHVPWREELLRLPAPALVLIVFSAFLLALLLKGYCISIVWRCYKFLTMRAYGLQPSRCIRSVMPGNNVNADYPARLTEPTATVASTAAPDYSSLLPKYEEAVKQSPPPSYRAATLMASNDVESTENAAQVAPAPNSTVVVMPQLGAQTHV